MDTVNFVQSIVPDGATILDVGCGSGLIARQLMASGFDVTAIDGNPDAVTEAERNGITAILCDFLEFDPGRKFDAILFARSFHHIHPLRKAMEKCKELVTAGGIVILDEFGADFMDEKSATWFYGVYSLLFAGGRERKGRGPKLLSEEMVSSPSDCLKAWRDHHFGKHGVATSDEMLRELRAHFEIEKYERVPYLYRYFSEDLTSEQLKALFLWENTVCQTGHLEAIGMRVFGRRS